MMKREATQPTIDRKLKQEVSKIKDSFDQSMPDDTLARNEALKALDRLFKQAENLPDMSLEEINVEIEKIRAARKVEKS